MKNTFSKILVIIALLFSFVGCASTRTQESTGEVIDDAAITTKVKSALIQDKEVSAMRIQVETYKGIVQLSGFANSQREAEKAGEVAGHVSGVKSVKNDIRVK
jgi:osmotically-inducible protein OsmY